MQFWEVLQISKAHDRQYRVLLACSAQNAELLPPPEEKAGDEAKQAKKAAMRQRIHEYFDNAS